MLLNLFTKKVLVELYSDHFIVRHFNRDGSQTEIETCLNDILSYSVQFPTDKISDIKFKLKNGMAIYYSFFHKKTAQHTDNEELINSFHSVIKKYNQQAPTVNKIVFLPSFYASTSGLVVISLLSSLLIIAIIIVALFKGVSSLPFTFIFTVVIIFHLIVKRKTELGYYKKNWMP
jgi:glutaredoxin 2